MNAQFFKKIWININRSIDFASKQNFNFFLFKQQQSQPEPTLEAKIAAAVAAVSTTSSVSLPTISTPTNGRLASLYSKS